MLLRSFFALILTLFLASFAFAGGARYDVVFDIDWTLFYPTKTPAATDSVQIGEEHYRLADGAVEIIAKLHTEGHRVSLFSGGKKERNAAIEKYLLERLKAVGVRDFAFHKVLNFDDLSPRPGAKEGARFFERHMKDLSLVNSDLNRVVIVDDLPKFAVPGQEKNMFSLGKTYTFYERFENAGQGEFDPPNEAEWRRERNKLKHFYSLFQDAIKNATGADVLERLQALNDERGLCSRVFSH